MKILLLSLIHISPTSNPEIIVAADITFSKYICVNITEDAQFGINPIIPAITGPNIGWFLKNPAIVSSPIKYITKFIIKVLITIKMCIRDSSFYNLF